VSSSGSQAPLITVPSKADDQPSWARVGVIAAIGFLVGVAWPRLAGVRLGPSLPEGAATAVGAEARPAESAALPAPQPLAAPLAPASPPLSTVATAVAAVSPEPERSASADRLKPALIKWDLALVRDSPKTGRVVARLPRGAAVRLGPPSEGWFPVKYGDDFASDGWLYRGAIGR